MPNWNPSPAALLRVIAAARDVPLSPVLFIADVRPARVAEGEPEGSSNTVPDPSAVGMVLVMPDPAALERASAVATLGARAADVPPSYGAWRFTVEGKAVDVIAQRADRVRAGERLDAAALALHQWIAARPRAERVEGFRAGAWTSIGTLDSLRIAVSLFDRATLEAAAREAGIAAA